MRIVDGKVIADASDYTLSTNTMHVVEAEGFVVFRCLTEDGQLFAAAIEEDRPEHEKVALANVVRNRAEIAPRKADALVVTK